jgi:putative ABC transport system permease protein
VEHVAAVSVFVADEVVEHPHPHELPFYGAVAYSVSRRTREVGIRIALGARPVAVVGLVMRQGLTVALAGMAIGGVLASGVARATSRVLYGVSGADPIAWVAAIAVLTGVSVLANVVPARRAARVDPMVALRQE